MKHLAHMACCWVLVFCSTRPLSSRMLRSHSHEAQWRGLHTVRGEVVDCIFRVDGWKGTHRSTTVTRAGDGVKMEVHAAGGISP